MSLRDAAEEYLTRGWMPIALGLDPAGKPKRPLQNDWPNTTPENALLQPWGQAKGIGIALGPRSGNLAVIDMDNQAFAAAVLAEFEKAQRPVYWVTTGRNNGHLYLIEERPSDPKTMRIEWGGETFSLELKARGQQVAAPPTVGYGHSGLDLPTTVPSIGEAWNSIALRMGIAIPDRIGSRSGSAGYPRAWQSHVSKGERNNALYVEACRLRDARMPLSEALSLMRARFDLAYDGGDADDRELVRTVQSAYRKPTRRQGYAV